MVRVMYVSIVSTNKETTMKKEQAQFILEAALSNAPEDVRDVMVRYAERTLKEIAVKEAEEKVTEAPHKMKEYEVILDCGSPKGWIKADSYMSNPPFTCFYMNGEGSVKVKVAEFKTDRIVSIIRKA